MSKFIQKKDCSETIRHGAKLLVCPNCKNHIQGECEEFHDCKEIIYKDELTKDGKLIQFCQCACYSKEHGVRD